LLAAGEFSNINVVVGQCVAQCCHMLRGAVLHGTHGTVLHGTVLPGTVLHGTVLHGTVLPGTLRYCTVNIMSLDKNCVISTVCTAGVF